MLFAHYPPDYLLMAWDKVQYFTEKPVGYPYQGDEDFEGLIEGFAVHDAKYKLVGFPNKNLVNTNLYFSPISHFTPKIRFLLCKHIFHTVYRFDLWYTVIKIKFYILDIY